MMAFEKQANDVIREVSSEGHVRLIDADRFLSGRQEWFADLVHFNDQGAAAIAELIARSLRPASGEQTLTEHGSRRND